MTTHTENRVHQRHSVRLNAEVMMVDRATEKVVTTIKGFVLDVSYGGLKLEIRALPAQVLLDLETGQLELSIAAQRDGQLIQIKGFVAWVKVSASEPQHVLIGVRFVAAVSKDVQKLVGWADASRRTSRWTPLLFKLGTGACLVILAVLWRGADQRAADAQAEVGRQVAARILAEQAAEKAKQAEVAEQAKLAREAGAKVTRPPLDNVLPSSAPFEVRLKQKGSGGAEVQVGSLRVEEGVLFGVLKRTNAGPKAKPLTVAIEIEFVDRNGTPGPPGTGCTVDPIEVGPSAVIDFDCGMESPAESSFVVTLTQSSR